MNNIDRIKRLHKKKDEIINNIDSYSMEYNKNLAEYNRLSNSEVIHKEFSSLGEYEKTMLKYKKRLAKIENSIKKYQDNLRIINAQMIFLSQQ